MIAVIRISGQIEVPKEVAEALHRLRIRRKYVCTLLNETPENNKLLNKIRNYVAFGEISDDVLKELVEKRAQPKPGEKVDVEKTLKEIKTKPLGELQIKPFFRLHPPRGGIDSKKHAGVSSKAVLGDNKEKINDLIRRML